MASRYGFRMLWVPVIIILLVTIFSPSAFANLIQVKSYNMPDGYCGIFCYRDDGYSGSYSSPQIVSDGYGGTFTHYDLSGGLGQLTDGIWTTQHWYEVEGNYSDNSGKAGTYSKSVDLAGNPILNVQRNGIWSPLPENTIGPYVGWRGVDGTNIPIIFSFGKNYQVDYVRVHFDYEFIYSTMRDGKVLYASNNYDVLSAVWMSATVGNGTGAAVSMQSDHFPQGDHTIAGPVWIDIPVGSIGNQLLLTMYPTESSRWTFVDEVEIHGTPVSEPSVFLLLIPGLFFLASALKNRKVYPMG
jgi:hypothetical protein